LRAFAKMLRTYGRGRAEQFRLHPTLGSAPNFVPPLFCLYLVFTVLFWGVSFFLSGLETARKVLLLPLALYAAVVVGQAVWLFPRGGCLRSLAAVPLIVLSHILYGVGFLFGWRTKFVPPSDRAIKAQVVLETVSLG